MGPAELQHRVTETLATGARRSPERLRSAAMSSPLRGLITAQIFAGMSRQFDRERGAGLDATVRWEIGEDATTPEEVWDLRIAGGRCRAERGGEGEATTTIGLGRTTLLELAVGLISAPQAYITGRMRMSGDVMLAQRLTGLIRVPGVPGSR